MVRTSRKNCSGWVKARREGALDRLNRAIKREPDGTRLTRMEAEKDVLEQRIKYGRD